MMPVFREENVKVIQAFISHYVSDSRAGGVVIGLSGGLDSTVILKLCVDAIGPGRVSGILMPESATPASNMIDIEHYANELGAGTRIIDISDIVRAFESKMDHDRPKLMGNVKARIRMTVLYHYANATNCIVVGTSNKSELLTGYYTKWGDGGSDINPIGDLYKTQVRVLAKHIGIPGKFIDKPPSGDLWEGQTDEAELQMSYNLLDRILTGIEMGLDNYEIEERTRASQEEIAHVRKLVHDSIHKRRLGLVPKLGLRTVGLDWREW